jgi:G:T/U-mismatch repair DNA glycosylase
MQESTLTPYLRQNLDILFVGLNPAKGSSENGHYFSVNQAFWNQLYESGLITKHVDKSNADEKIFGSNTFNYNNLNYGITDLVTEIAESNSSKVKPKQADLIRLKNIIIYFKPKTVVLIHGKVLKKFITFLGYEVPDSNTGKIGCLIENCETFFFNIAFPHGNTITKTSKINRYRELKHHIISTK